MNTFVINEQMEMFSTAFVIATVTVKDGVSEVNVQSNSKNYGGSFELPVVIESVVFSSDRVEKRPSVRVFFIEDTPFWLILSYDSPLNDALDTAVDMFMKYTLQTKATEGVPRFEQLIDVYQEVKNIVHNRIPQSGYLWQVLSMYLSSYIDTVLAKILKASF